MELHGRGISSKRLYEVSQQVGGFGRHIDGPIFVKFSKVKFGNKIQLFLVSINVVSVSILETCPRDGPGRLADGHWRQHRHFRTRQNHPFWIGDGLAISGACAPSPAPPAFPRFHASTCGTGLCPPFTARDARPTDEGQLTLPLICFPRVPRPSRTPCRSRSADADPDLHGVRPPHPLALLHGLNR